MSSASGSEYALLYQEPDALRILILTAFLLAGNILNFLLDKLIYCGLIGQILVGTAFGSPGGKLLSDGSEELITNLGYLGLILLVYEGGLSTNLDGIRHNLPISLCVCLTGVILPIAFSYVLLPLVNASPLQAFAAGAALCSTSLGTTFTILTATGLQHTRIGLVLKSAAMLDDVIGLIMVQVIMDLGTSQDSFSAVTVVRPIFVALGFAFGLFVMARFLIMPLAKALNKSKLVKRLSALTYAPLVLHTAILIGLTTGASYAGTSNLYAAFLAGVTVSWWDKRRRPPATDRTTSNSLRTSPIEVIDNQAETPAIAVQEQFTSGQAVYEKYYANLVSRILQPFFFASIGFSIPITRLWTGSILWRGITYAALMLVAKLLCGVWLLRLPEGVKIWFSDMIVRRKPQASANRGHRTNHGNIESVRNDAAKKGLARRPDESKNSIELRDRRQSRGKEPVASPAATPAVGEQSDPTTAGAAKAKKPVSLYPGCIVGLGMVARGEIGFLISAIAEKQGLFGKSGLSEIYLVVTWAILLCTIVGPLGVGLITKRVHRLQADKEEGSFRVLGDWGLEEYDPRSETVGCNSRAVVVG